MTRKEMLGLTNINIIRLRVAINVDEVATFKQFFLF